MSVAKNSLDGKKLMGFLERIEILKRQEEGIRNDIKVVRAEAEADGFSGKGLTVALKARAQKPSQFREQEDVRDVYLHAIGMAAPPPLFKHLEALASDKLGRNELIERFKELVPPGASIIIEMEGPPVRLFRDEQGNPHAQEVQPAKEVVEKASPAPFAGRPAAEVPNCTPDQAEELGAKAYEGDQPVTANPFPFGDKRQPRWDAGWRKRSGSDGMGPDTGGGPA
jgi:uncharacterized protein (UPF0335 family)